MNNEAFDHLRQSLARKIQAPNEPKPLSQEEIDTLFQQRITPETDLPPMQPLFQMFDTPCFYRGELVADCGKAKSGKTTFLSLLMACAIGLQKVLALERSSEAALKVLWIDTEQSQESTQEILKERVVPLAQPTVPLNDHLFAFNLRGLGYEARKRLVDVAVRSVNPDLVIIDGIKDLMTDINDAVQATLIMEQLMALANDQKCCIVCVLHQNKSEQDRNMRGSIGTELTNKAFEVFQCETLDESTVFKVTQTYSRKQRMRQKLYYQLGETGLPVLQNDYREQPRDDHGRWMSTNTSPTATVGSEVNLLEIFTKAMEGRYQRPFSELMAVALKKCGVVDAKTYYAYLAEAEAKGIIRKEVHPDTGTTWVELVDNSLPF